MHKAVAKILLGTLWLVFGCSQKTISFKSELEAKVFLVPWEKPQSDGVELGKLPVDVDPSQLSSNFLRIKSPGQSPQNWVFVNTVGDQLDVEVKFEEIAAAENSLVMAKEIELKAKAIRSQKLLLRAYDALSKKRYKESISLADGLAKIFPDSPSPYIVMGLAHLQLREQAQASSAFQKAQSLDPNDSAIDELIKISKQ